MSRMTPIQVHALATVSLGVVDAVEAGGQQGAPAGVLYAAMQAQGASFVQFMNLMATMVGPGYLTLELKTKLTNILAAFAS